MTKLTKAPEMHRVLGQSIFKYQERFPGETYNFDLPVLLRHVYVNYKEEQRDKGVSVEITGYGTVEMHDRNYVFTPTDAYRTAKGYEERIEGRW